jgi:hypothetical protein
MALALLASLGGCVEEAPSLSAGTLSYRVSAIHKTGCTLDELFERTEARTVSLQAPMRAQVMEMGNTAWLEANANPAALTLNFAAGVARRCGQHCAGGEARAALRWEGTLTLPATAPEWDVRFTISALHTAPDRVEVPAGQCVIETPWRAPIVIDAASLERTVTAPAGVATLRVVCDSPMPPRGLVAVACIGAPRDPPPLEVSPAWIEGRLTIRMEATPR